MVVFVWIDSFYSMYSYSLGGISVSLIWSRLTQVGARSYNPKIHMRLISFRNLLRFASLVAVLSIASYLHAQSPTELELPSESQSSAASKLTPQQMQKAADDHLARMDQSARSIRRQLKQARTKRDVIKVLCLNDKINQIDVALSSAGDRRKALQGVIDRGDADRAKHEFTIISVLRQRVDTLVSEANQCVGEETGFAGDSDVTVELDPSLPDVSGPENPANAPLPGQPPPEEVEIEHPSLVSPFGAN